MANNTISDHMTHLKKMISRAMKQGTLKKNPFFGYRHQQTEMVCRYLQPDELERIMQTHIPSRSLCYIRDIFVFACFTGLAYADLCNLSEENLKTGDNGKMWICIERQKSKTDCYIPLMKLPLQIIEKYRYLRKDGKIFKTVPSGSLPVELLQETGGYLRSKAYHFPHGASYVCHSNHALTRRFNRKYQ